MYSDLLKWASMIQYDKAHCDKLCKTEPRCTIHHLFCACTSVYVCLCMCMCAHVCVLYFLDQTPCLLFFCCPLKNFHTPFLSGYYLRVAFVHLEARRHQRWLNTTGVVRSHTPGQTLDFSAANHNATTIRHCQ